MRGIDSETKHSISRACGYMIGPSADESIARIYGVRIRDVQAIRRQKPEPRPMMQHEPVPDASINADEERARELGQRCATHNARLWDYFTNRGADYRLTREEYCALVNSNLGVSEVTAKAMRLARRSVPMG